MNAPVLLDLFCGAGGAGAGYALAGFHVIGVDIKDQPNYPFTFIKADVMELDLPKLVRASGAVAVHTSPPCQKFTAYRRRGGGVGDSYPNLIPETRTMLRDADLPFVIENVESAREHLIDPIRLCGSSFGLDVRRHRLFESNVQLATPACNHAWQTPRFTPASNRTNLRKTVEIGVYRIPLAVQQKAMGIAWMRLGELSQAIPPAYTTFLGGQLIAGMRRGDVAA